MWSKPRILQSKTKQKNHKQTKTAKTHNHDHIERKHLFSTDPLILFQPVKRVVSSFFFFGNPVTYCRLLNCSNATFLRGMGSTSLSGSFVFLQEVVVDHSLLWEDERPWERGWSGIGHKNAKTNTRAQR